MANRNTRCVSKRISLLLLIVLAFLCLLDILSGYFLKNITNLQKILIYAVIFIIPIFFYLRLNRYKASSMLKLRHVKFKYLPFIILFGISVSVICALINAGAAAVLSNFWNIKIPTSTVSFASDNPAVVILTHVFLPAFCEELLIRGVALSEYEKYGVSISVLLTATVFSLFHGSVVTFLSLFVAGVCYAVLTHIFKSVWPAIICHVINNALAVYINYHADFIKYLAEDFIFIVIVAAILFIILYITLRLTENVIDDLGDKKRLKTNTRKLVYGEPLGSVYIWIFFALSIFISVRNLGLW